MKTKKQSDCATVWFAILERAINLGDTEREAEARQKLEDRLLSRMCGSFLVRGGHLGRGIKRFL